MEVMTHSTDRIAPPQRAAHWDRVISETYFPLHLTFREARDFSGRLVRRQLGQVSLSRLTTEALQFERRPHHLSHIREEEYLITLPRHSPVEFRQLGREVRCDPGGFILERGDEPYRFSYDTANDLNVLKVSKRALAEKVRDPDRFCAKIVDARAGVPALFANLMGQLQGLDLAQDHAATLLGRQLVEVLALALDDRIDQDDGVRSAVRAGHLRRAERLVRQNLSSPDLSPELVADACGISKRYLHELFSDTNKTVSQFIREERLIAARDIIATSRGLAMAEVAYRFGFSDQAQFSRLFKGMFGMTPTDWKRRGNLH